MEPPWNRQAALETRQSLCQQTHARWFTHLPTGHTDARQTHLQVASKQEENLEQFRAALEPARAVLAACPWLSGLQSGPGWADICLLSEFMV